MRELVAVTLAGGERTVPRAAVDALTGHLEGAILRPGDAGYDAARRVWNGLVDHHPALIARCASTADVAAAVRFGREHDILTSVRGGGHNIAGKAIADGGLVIDLSALRAVEVDAERRVARVAGGTLLGEMDRATLAFGLATTAGVVTHTGVGGLTLGGGVGRLARRFGLACDNLLAAEVVTADGEVARADPDADADLFWAIRGGGGNFGVVTSFEFRLHPVGPLVLAGIVVHPLDRAVEALAFYDGFASSAPDALSVDAVLLTLPDGQPGLAHPACWSGPLEEGERELAPLRAFGPPVVDDIGPVPYVAVQATTDAFFPIGAAFYWKSRFFETLGPGAREASVEAFRQATSPRSVIVFQQYGGSIGRVGAADTAFAHRDAQWDGFAAAVWDDGDGERAVHEAWVRAWYDAVRPFAARGEYVNNLGEEGDDRVRAAYGENYDRLATLKRRYDPTNFFRLNANIAPA